MGLLAIALFAGICLRRQLVNSLADLPWHYSVPPSVPFFAQARLNVTGSYASPAYPPSRTFPCSFALEPNTIFVFGGTDDARSPWSGHLKGDLWTYELTETLWTFLSSEDPVQDNSDFHGRSSSLPAFPGARAGCAFDFVNDATGSGVARLVGGYGYSTNTSSSDPVRGFLIDIWEYSVTDNLWTSRSAVDGDDEWLNVEPSLVLPVHPPGLANFIHITVENHTYVLLGESMDSQNILPVVYIFNDTSGTWETNATTNSSFPFTPSGGETFWPDEEEDLSVYILDGISGEVFYFSFADCQWTQLTFYGDVRGDVNGSIIGMDYMIGARNHSAAAIVYWGEAWVVGGRGYGGLGDWDRSRDRAESWLWVGETEEWDYGQLTESDIEMYVPFDNWASLSSSEPRFSGRSGHILHSLEMPVPAPGRSFYRVVLLLGGTDIPGFGSGTFGDVWVMCDKVSVFGPACDLWECDDGNLVNETEHVCSGHGSCVGPTDEMEGECVCESSEWYGVFCELHNDTSYAPIARRFLKRSWYSNETCGGIHLEYTDSLPLRTCLSPDGSWWMSAFLLNWSPNRAISILSADYEHGIEYFEYDSLDCRVPDGTLYHVPINMSICQKDTRVSPNVDFYIAPATHYVLEPAFGGAEVDLTDPRIGGDMYWGQLGTSPILTRRKGERGRHEHGNSIRRSVAALDTRMRYFSPQYCAHSDWTTTPHSTQVHRDIRRGCRATPEEEYTIRVYSSETGDCDDSLYFGTRVYPPTSQSFYPAPSMGVLTCEDMDLSTVLGVNTNTAPFVTRDFFHSLYDEHCNETSYYSEVVPLKTCYRRFVASPGSQILVMTGDDGDETGLVVWIFDSMDCSGPPSSVGHLNVADDCIDAFGEFRYRWNTSKTEPDHLRVHLAMFPDCAVVTDLLTQVSPIQIIEKTASIALPTSFCWGVVDEEWEAWSSIRGYCEKGKVLAEWWLDSEFCHGEGESFVAGTCFENHWTSQVAEYASCYLPMCYGIYANESATVCSGSGSCISRDTCLCLPDYAGEQCEDFTLVPVVDRSNQVVLAVFLILLFALLGVVALAATAVFFYLFRRFRRQKASLEKFEELDDVELILEEQRLQKSQNLGRLRINKRLFEIDTADIKLLKLLGEGGGSATVYLALWKGQKVAYKSFKLRTMAASSEVMDEFEKELNIMASVHHPGILSFLGACLHPPIVGYIMELCSNGDLEDFLTRWPSGHDGEHYPTTEKIRLLRETADAMSYLHGLKIIHRDIKPGNILVDDTYRAKLMDFGISRFVEKTESVAMMTKRVGTRDYLAPEVFRGVYDEKCDVYSFGVLVYVILSEEYIPYGESSYMVEQMVVTDPTFRPDVAKISEIADEWLVELMKRCWAHDATIRPSFPEILSIFDDKNVVQAEVATDDTEVVSPFPGQPGPVQKDRKEVDEETLLRLSLLDLDSERDMLKEQVKELHELVSTVVVPTDVNVIVEGNDDDDDVVHSSAPVIVAEDARPEEETEGEDKPRAGILAENQLSDEEEGRISEEEKMGNEEGELSDVAETRTVDEVGDGADEESV